MTTPITCPECFAIHNDGLTCVDDFHQMLFWEAEDPALGIVHHLMVLCYHLQHPGLYSPEGLRYSRQLLSAFIEEGLTPAEVRRRSRDTVDSGKRNWKIKGDITPGSYDCAIQWTMTAADVVAGGMTHYVENVTVWAQSVHESLKVWNP
jgi:hypothetical protein